MTLTIVARDDLMQEVGPLDGFESIDMDLRHMAAGGTVGSCQLVVPIGHPTLPHLIDTTGPRPQPRGGIVVRRVDSRTPTVAPVVASGLVVVAETDDDAGTVTLQWVPDDSILAAELAYTDTTADVPATAVASTSAAQDTRTGTAGQVIAGFVGANIGPAAGVARRRYPWLTVPSSGSLAGVGTSGTWSARDEPLIDVLQRVAAGTGVAWRLIQASASTVALQVWAPSTTPVARYSSTAGTVTGVRTRLERRATDEVIVGGGGDGTSRARTRRSLTVPAGTVRRVQWALQGSSTSLSELRQAADQALADGDEPGGGEFNLVEDPTRMRGLWGLDWRLGDVLSVASRSGVVVNAPCVAVRVTQGPGEQEPTISPRIGSRDSVGSVTARDELRRLVSPLLRS